MVVTQVNTVNPVTPDGMSQGEARQGGSFGGRVCCSLQVGRTGRQAGIQRHGHTQR